MKKTLLSLLFATLFFSASAKADTAYTGNSYVSFATSLKGSALDNSNASLLRDYRLENLRVGRKSRFRQLDGDTALRSPFGKRLVRRVVRLFHLFGHSSQR